MKRRKLEFSSHTGNLALMRTAVRSFLNDYGFSEKERTLMVLGVDEACTNIIRYAYELRDDRLICLSMEELHDCVRLRVRDYGKRISENALKHRAADGVRPGGLGLHLIRNAFDRINYNARARGTELVLTKNLGN
jgi:serine/threonine-protein kinase RsbW